MRFIHDGKWTILVYRILSGSVILCGGYVTLQEAWSIIDLAMALMTILNMTALILLSKYVFVLYQDYERQRKEGKDPVFKKDLFPDDDIEAWDATD